MKSGQGSYGERIVISSGLLCRSLNLQAIKETPYYLDFHRNLSLKMGTEFCFQ